MQRQREANRRWLARKQAREQLAPRTPEALEGRKHIDIQTEELSDHIEVTNAECQTDAVLDKPATPLFIPAKSGKDVATQIEEGELFDFDREVQPVLEVLVGKTLEQSLLEVMEEEELACMRAQLKASKELRNVELAEVQRLEEKEREEKKRRLAQQREVLQKERETVEKIAARAYAQFYLADLVPSCFTTLRGHGYFYDPVERDIETNFFPWLMAEVNNNLERRDVARGLLDMLIYDVTQKTSHQLSDCGTPNSTESEKEQEVFEQLEPPK
ncbi:radial spoke head protein 3 homolog B-like [Diretmus argenteus]